MKTVLCSDGGGIVKKRKIKLEGVISLCFLIVLACVSIIPFIMMVSASLSNEEALMQQGYGLVPRKFTLDAYKYVFANPKSIKDSYVVTIASTIIGTICGLFLTSLTAYPLSRKDYVWRKKLSGYFYFPCLFSGGAVASYILIAQYLKLSNTFAVLIIPTLMSVWNIFVMRTYFMDIGSEVVESARIDGAGEYAIFFRIVMPMSQVGLATVGFLIMLTFWNSWYPCLMYMSNGKYTTLQFYLTQIMSNIDSMLKLGDSGQVAFAADESILPRETVRMAICMLAVGPMALVFLYFQRFFAKGINLGSVKG